MEEIITNFAGIIGFENRTESEKTKQKKPRSTKRLFTNMKNLAGTGLNPSISNSRSTNNTWRCSKQRMPPSRGICFY